MIEKLKKKQIEKMLQRLHTLAECNKTIGLGVNLFDKPSQTLDYHESTTTLSVHFFLMHDDIIRKIVSK